MHDYTAVTLRFEADTAPELVDVLAQLLADSGFESFENAPDSLTAYIPAAAYAPALVDDALAQMPVSIPGISYSAEHIAGRDWNVEWEQHYFRPITVAGRVCVHSSFHTDYPRCTYDILIDPKMAFGTGHHATTSLMMKRLLYLQPAGQQVVDMGTGTAILAILADKLGAAAVTGIEIDPYAADNARENTALNGCRNVQILTGDAALLPDVPTADIFLANINRNIITADLPAYAATLRPGGMMALSGFYLNDVDIVVAAAADAGLTLVDTLIAPDMWACILLTKQ